MNTDAFERGLRAVLADRAPADVPPALAAHVAALPSSAGRGWQSRSAGLGAVRSNWLERLGPLAFTGLAVALIAAIAGLALFYAGRAPAHVVPGAGGTKAIVWQTNLASLEADAVSVETADQVFSAAAGRFAVSSDPGTDTYRTLEIAWRENAVEMRMNLYFAADASHWWVSEVRVYDGRPEGEWITFPGPMFRTERGRSFVGNVDLSGRNRRGPGRLRIDGARLTAFVPGTGPRPFEGCRIVGPSGPGVPWQPVLQELDPDLSEFGLAPGMDAREAYDQITRQGICYEFRLVFPALNADQRWCLPPPGKVREFLFGSEGQLLVFVEDPARNTHDPNMPDFIGCN